MVHHHDEGGGFAGGMLGAVLGIVLVAVLILLVVVVWRPWAADGGDDFDVDVDVDGGTPVNFRIVPSDYGVA